MSPQGTTLAAKPETEMVVDAYVDALLALPVAPPATVPASPESSQPPPSAELDDAMGRTLPEDTAVPEAPTDHPPLPGATRPDVGEDIAAPATAVSEPAPGTLVEAWEPEADPEAAGAPIEPDGGPSPASASGDAPEAHRLDEALSGAAAPPSIPAPAPGPPRPAAPMFVADEGAEEIAPAEAPVGQRWLRVAVGDDRYAVELLRVQEVVLLAPLIAVRGAAPSLLGVMNLRGRVVPVHDLGRWLRRAPVEVDERSRIVVLEFQDELVGLLVTAVTDVVTLDGPQIEPPTRGLRDRIGMGIARTPGAPPTVLLDARVVFD